MKEEVIVEHLVEYFEEYGYTVETEKILGDSVRCDIFIYDKNMAIEVKSDRGDLRKALGQALQYKVNFSQFKLSGDIYYPDVAVFSTDIPTKDKFIFERNDCIDMPLVSVSISKGGEVQLDPISNVGEFKLKFSNIYSSDVYEKPKDVKYTTDPEKGITKI